MIVDASALVVSLGSAKAARTFRGSDLAAPDLLISETLNAFWKLRRARQATPDRSLVLALLDSIRIIPSRNHAARAAELADELDHPVYDCLYLALAEAEADVLITADARLVARIKDRSLRKRVRILS